MNMNVKYKETHQVPSAQERIVVSLRLPDHFSTTVHVAPSSIVGDLVMIARQNIPLLAGANVFRMHFIDPKSSEIVDLFTPLVSYHRKELVILFPNDEGYLTCKSN